MKTSRDPRHLKRIAAVKELFAWSFKQDTKLQNKIAQEIANKVGQIDNKIEVAAPTWPIKQINKIDLAILRLAIYELMFQKNLVETNSDINIINTDQDLMRLPYKVVVDEAVELAKEFGSESSPSFINGVLGTIVKLENIEKGEK